MKVCQRAKAEAKMKVCQSAKAELIMRTGGLKHFFSIQYI